MASKKQHRAKPNDPERQLAILDGFWIEILKHPDMQDYLSFLLQIQSVMYHTMGRRMPP